MSDDRYTPLAQSPPIYLLCSHAQVYKMRNKKTPRKGMRETEGGQLPPSHQPSPVAITSAQKGNNPTETTLPAANGNQNCDSYPYLRNMLHRVSRLMRSRKGSSHDDDQGNG